MHYLREVDFTNKSIVLRVDYNVPIHNNVITDTYRIDMTMETLYAILKQPFHKLYIISHLGRPKGKYVKDLDLSIIHAYLSDKLQQPIHFESGVLKKQTIECEERIVLLDNIRFHPEEESTIMDDSVLAFRKYLTSLCDIYINEAFGCCHRPHSSIVGIHAPIKCPGLLMESEMYYLENIFNSFKGHKTAIVGGSKVYDKIKLLLNIIPKVDTLVIGGGMAFTILKYMGYSIGSSLFDEKGYSFVPEIMENVKKHNTRLILPVDFVCNSCFSNTGSIIKTTLLYGIPEHYMGLDIGEKTIENIKQVCSDSDCIIWNGPLGVFEFENFANGSRSIMEHMASLSDVTTIIGGGDTASCCRQFNCHNKMSWVSTGGGSSLTMIEDGLLPGVEFLKE